MTWNRAELLAWLDRTEPMVDRLTPFELLEMPPTASGPHVQRAFHAIAATRHPDVWRNHLDAAERERLIRVYGRVAAAYATLRNDESRAGVLRRVREKRPSDAPEATEISDRADRDRGGERTSPDESGARRRPARATVPTDPPSLTPPPMRGETAAGTAPPPTRASTVSASPPPPPSAGGQAHLGARAIGFYRRAEASLRVGDVAGALLNLRMALAAEPSSQFLKDAIADAQKRLRK